MVHPFSSSELNRYSRQFQLPEVGIEGQARLKASSVLLVGAGGLGSPVAMHLAAAGVGRIGIVDFDTVDETNLHRQLLYGESDIGRPKLEAAADRIHEVNPHIQVELHDARLDASNAIDLISGFDVVADGTDNFETRYLVNDACVVTRTPNAFASISKFDGQVSVFCAPGGPCYRCLFAEPPPRGTVPSCAETGVIGVLPGLLGTIQAAEVLKLLLGIGESLNGRLLLVDSLSMRFRSLNVAPDPACPACGEVAAITSLKQNASFVKPTEQAQSINMVPEITVHDYLELRESENPPFLLDVRQPEESALTSLGGELIPLGILPLRLDELAEYKADEVLVVHCHMGGRSAQAVQFLRRNGFDNVVNLKGGMLAWEAAFGPSILQD